MVVSHREAVLVGSPSFRLDYEIEQYIASKFMIDTGAGVIDADYRGTVFVLLYNYSDADFQGIFIIIVASIHIHCFIVEEGDRIAQLILERIYTPDILEVQVCNS